MTAPGGRADGGPPAPGAALVLRPRRLLIVGWICAVLTIAFFAAVALLLPSTPTGVFFRLADQVALMLVGLFVAGGALLLARPRVRADAAGIEVRNVLGTRTLPWDAVERVAFPDGASWARLDLPDDEYLPVMAVQAVDGARAVAGIRRLRALHTAARAPGPVPRPTGDAVPGTAADAGQGGGPGAALDVRPDAGSEGAARNVAAPPD